MKEGIGWGLFLVSLVVIAYMYFGNKPLNISGDNNSDPSDDEVKCELKDAYGRTVTITGKANDPQFVSLCQRQQNQQVYVYGYPYYFVRYWKHTPEPTPDPAPEA